MKDTKNLEEIAETPHLDKIAETVEKSSEAGYGFFDTIINVIRNLIDMQ